MSSLAIKRRALFNKYSANLHMLVDSGILNISLEFEHTYICPICMRQFSEDALDQTVSNPLTFEDVPPKSLGGKSNILTCSECNNYCGRHIDYHLTHVLSNKDFTEFVPNSSFSALFTNKDGIEVKGNVVVGQDKSMSVIQNNKNNKPNLVDNLQNL